MAGIDSLRRRSSSRSRSSTHARRPLMLLFTVSFDYFSAFAAAFAAAPTSTADSAADFAYVATARLPLFFSPQLTPPPLLLPSLPRHCHHAAVAKHIRIKYLFSCVGYRSHREVKTSEKNSMMNDERAFFWR